MVSLQLWPAGKLISIISFIQMGCDQETDDVKPERSKVQEQNVSIANLTDRNTPPSVGGVLV